MDRSKAIEKEVAVFAGNIMLNGNLCVPEGAKAIILFAHGTGSSRFSPRNRFVARYLNDSGLATLLLDLLTEEEEKIDAATMALRFDINMLADRLMGATDWIANQERIGNLKVGYFGASTGAGAALIAAAAYTGQIFAVVSRGGRPDLAENSLSKVKAPTLLIVGGNDYQVIELNQEALNSLRRSLEKRLIIVQGATHLFEEPGALEEVASLACEWFLDHLQPSFFKHAI